MTATSFILDQKWSLNGNVHSKDVSLGTSMLLIIKATWPGKLDFSVIVVSHSLIQVYEILMQIFPYTICSELICQVHSVYALMLYFAAASTPTSTAASTAVKSSSGWLMNGTWLELMEYTAEPSGRSAAMPI